MGKNYLFKSEPFSIFCSLIHMVIFISRWISMGLVSGLVVCDLSAHPGHEEEVSTSAGGAAGLPAPQVSITEEGGYRVIKANGVPNHEIGQFPGPGCPNAASADRPRIWATCSVSGLSGVTISILTQSPAISCGFAFRSCD